MNRPDIAAVLAAHLPRDRYNEEGESIGTYCTCGRWTGDYFADGEAGPFDAHLAAALHAEVARWLEDEGTEAVVADALTDAHWCESNYTRGCNCLDWRLTEASHVLAALTHREDTP